MYIYTSTCIRFLYMYHTLPYSTILHVSTFLLGFSFGGMLACCIAANIWRRSPINADVLKEQVICITFGQPLICIPFVQEVIQNSPQFESTIYSMFTKDDIIPGLLQYFHIGCVHYRHGSRSPMKTPPATNGTKAPVQPLQPVIALQPKMVHWLF